MYCISGQRESFIIQFCISFTLLMTGIMAHFVMPICPCFRNTVFFCSLLMSVKRFIIDTMCSSLKRSQSAGHHQHWPMRIGMNYNTRLRNKTEKENMVQKFKTHNYCRVKLKRKKRFRRRNKTHTYTEQWLALVKPFQWRWRVEKKIDNNRPATMKEKHLEISCKHFSVHFVCLCSAYVLLFFHVRCALVSRSIFKILQTTKCAV